MSIVLALVMNVNAQVFGGSQTTDSFFYTDEGKGNRNSNGTTEFGLMPLLPDHGIYKDQLAIDDTPLGSGWLLLSGIGVGYLLLKRRKEE